MRSREKLLSIVVPLHNEEGNVEKLHSEICGVLKANELRGEIVFVEDGSVDETLKRARVLVPLKLIVMRRNFGQTAAMDAGIKAAKGDIIITMDGDLQNDPNDIPNLLDKLDEGFDVVAGWRKNRKDNWSRRFFSRGADKLRKILINDQINDSGCTLKALKKECFEGIDLFGEMHRFIPALLKIKGFKVSEIVVNHRERMSGNTNYDSKRLLKGLLDLCSVWFWKKFSNRPLHLFGGVGFISSTFGFILLLWMAYEKILLHAPIGNRVWPMIGVFSIILGVQFFVSGLMADIMIKTYYQTKRETSYSIEEIIENE